jgi:hypothetical protein
MTRRGDALLRLTYFSTQGELFEIKLWHRSDALEELPFSQANVLRPWASRNHIADLIKT